MNILLKDYTTLFISRKNILVKMVLVIGRWDNMLKRFCRWILASEMVEEYIKGVEDGVNQYHHDPDSAMHMVVQEYY